MTGLSDTNYAINAGVANSSTAPSEGDVFNPFSIDGVLAGVQSLTIISTALLGTQFVILKFGELFAFLQPITLALATIITLIQIFVIAYMAISFARGIFGRRV